MENEKIKRAFETLDKWTDKAVIFMAVFVPFYVLYQLIFNN